MLHQCLISRVINSKYQHRAIPGNHGEHRKHGIPWTSCLLLLAGGQFSSLFTPQKQPAFLGLCLITNSFLLRGPGRLRWNTIRKALEHPTIYQTLLEMTSISTLSSPSSHALQDSSSANFQKVSFSFQKPLLSPKLLVYSCLLGAELACKLPQLLKLNRTWGLWIQFMPHGAGWRSRRVCQALRLPGHLIRHPALDLVSEPQFLQAHTICVMNHFSDAVLQKHVEGESGGINIKSDQPF